LVNAFAGADDLDKTFGATTTYTLLAPAADSCDGYVPDLAFFSGTDPVTLAVEAIGTLTADLPGTTDLLSSALVFFEV
jgi:hypothetical protein